MIKLPEYITAALHEIIKCEGFTEHSIELSPGCKHGDGFLGVLTAVTVTGQRNVSGQLVNDALHLLCKMAPANPVRRQQFQSAMTFAREAQIYNEILPLFAEFQRDRGLSPDEGYTAYPKCYAAIANSRTDQYYLILEDVRARNFAMRPKTLAVSVNHAFLIVEHLAKLHAISFALKDQRPAVYERLRTVDDLLTKFFRTPHMSNVFMATYDRAIAALDDPRHIQIVDDMKVNHVKYLTSFLIGDACDPYGVIVHGDCWQNNILYRLQKGNDENPEELCFIDYQASKFVSPVLDLFYNIFSSTDTDLRQREYHNIMKHYHETLSTGIRRLGSDPDKLFSYDAFAGELKRFGKYPFLIGPMQTQMIVANPKDIPDLDEFSEGIVNDNKVDFVLDYDEITQLEYNRKINNLFKDLIALDYWT